MIKNDFRWERRGGILRIYIFWDQNYLIIGQKVEKMLEIVGAFWEKNLLFREGEGELKMCSILLERFDKKNLSGGGGESDTLSKTLLTAKKVAQIQVIGA